MSSDERIDAVLGVGVVRSAPLHGGDINGVRRVWLVDGRQVVVKRRRPGSDAGADLFFAEADGLAWLAEAEALAVPQVLAVDETQLVLEYLEPGPSATDFDVRLGRGLAALHRFGAPLWGLHRDNYIGPLQQSGAATEDAADWPAFYAAHRLLPMARRADRGTSGRWTVRVEALARRLAALLGPAEPPSRLHGDLWGGNLHRDPAGQPVLIDPAVYGGHREMDLAMMRLFGGFGPAVFDAYDEAWPLAPGWRERVPLHQLYPLLVHLVLFGRGYEEQVDAILRRHGC